MSFFLIPWRITSPIKQKPDSKNQCISITIIIWVKGECFYFFHIIFWNNLERMLLRKKAKSVVSRDRDNGLDQCFSNLRVPRHHLAIFLKDRPWLKSSAGSLPSCIPSTPPGEAAAAARGRHREPERPRGALVVPSKSGTPTILLISHRVLKKEAKWKFILSLKSESWKGT